MPSVNISGVVHLYLSYSHALYPTVDQPARTGVSNLFRARATERENFAGTSHNVNFSLC